MKTLLSVILLFTCLSVNAQIKMGTTVNPDGSSSPNFSVQLNKPTTTVTSQVNFEYPNGVFPEPIAYKKGANKKTYVLLANVSSPEVSEFEIDIFAGNKSLSKATLLVKLMATSASKERLFSGTYNYNAKGPAARLKYEFDGTVKLGDVDVPIAAGQVTVSRTEKQIEIDYNLTLTNGVKTTGKYNTDYQIEDRSKIIR
ncbi:MAG: hypothetical protein EOO92_15350 [Pedobacter sp.]|nr:MAG: hypothetical protein EOO92_15350 [Pedobacter sp.]